MESDAGTQNPMSTPSGPLPWSKSCRVRPFIHRPLAANQGRASVAGKLHEATASSAEFALPFVIAWQIRWEEGTPHLLCGRVLDVAGTQLYGVLQQAVLGLQALLLHGESLHLRRQLLQALQHL